MNKFLFILLAFVYFEANAQIAAPDTACIANPVPFNAYDSALENTWLFDTVDIKSIPNNSLTNPGTLSGLSNAVFGTMNYDNGNWYSFITNYNNLKVIRLDYGSNPTGTPTTTDLGNFSVSSTQREGIEVLKDSASGNWYGFSVSGNILMRINFGTNIANNSPTVTTYNFASQFAWPHQIGIAKYGNQWVGFVANRNGSIVRLDFGTSMTNAPSATVLPSVGSMSAPCNFALYKQNGNWYMLVTNLINATMTRLNFGTNIQNNNPTGTSLGNPGNLLNLPRSVCLISDCNQLIGYVINENGNLTQLDFNNDITSTPTVVNIGFIGHNNINSFTPFIYNGVQYLQLITFSTATVYQKRIVNYPSGTVTTHVNPAYNKTFSSFGKKIVTLYQNQGSFMGSKIFCDDIYITAGGSTYLNDTTICDGDSFLLDASITNAKGYTWNTGATTSGIWVKNAGKYWVTITGADTCYTNSDTANITLSKSQQVNLGPDTSFCNGDTITLQHMGSVQSGATYTWSTGSGLPAIKVGSTGKYWLKIDFNGNCPNTDTVDVTALVRPQVDLGNDSFFCTGDTLTLYQRGPNYPSATYTWNDTLVAYNYYVTKPGYYKLEIKTGGCTGADSVLILDQAPIKVDLGEDSSFCEGQYVTLANKLPNTGANTYKWSNGYTSPIQQVYVGGTYWLEASINGKCGDADTINLTMKPSPKIELGPDTTICVGTEFTLSVLPQPAGSSFSWSNGSTDPDIKVTGKGRYTVTVTNNQDCSTSDSIDVLALDVPYFRLPEDTVLCMGDALIIKIDDLKYPVSYQWSDGSTANFTTLTQTGTYYLRIFNKCGEKSDAINADFQNCDIWFPSAFSPNGDGRNDKAHLLGNYLGISDYKLSIYDRWGKRVFVTENVVDGWDGVYKGKPQLLGTYFYMIQYTFRGEQKLMKGDITLVR